MKTLHRIFTAALLAAGISAIASEAAVAGYYWDAGCGCQRPIAYVAPQPHVLAPTVVYRPRVVYEAVPAYVAVPQPYVAVSGCCARGIFSGYYGGYYGHGYGVGYAGYGHAYGAGYGYGPTD